VKKNTKIVAAGLALLAGGTQVTMLTGCATLQPIFEPGITPTVPQYLDLIDKTIQQIMKEREAEVVTRCAGSGDPQCANRVREEYNVRLRELNALRVLILQQSWQDARTYLEKLRDKYKDLVPQYPELKRLLELIEEMLRKLILTSKGTATPSLITPTTITPAQTTDLILNSSASDMAMARGGSPNSSNLSKSVDSLAKQPGGNIQLLRAPEHRYAVAVQVTAPSGSFDITGSFNTRGGLGVGTHPVTAGSLRLGAANGVGFTTNVVRDTLSNVPSTLTINADGTGVLRIVLGFNAAPIAVANQANWYMSSPAVLSFPVRVGANGVLTIEGSGQDIFGHDNWAASDYNQDGVLSRDADFAAFMHAFSKGEPLADSNFDGSMTNEDIELWVKRFDEDMSFQR
jgi:hypothetical protein